jgi:predicted RNA-binding Zn-ribbon protein involved in translation (DUF1610 family)
MIRFACSNCNSFISIDRKYAGKKYKCPKCGGIVVVPKRSTIIVFACGSCGHKIRAPESYDGKKGTCPKCKSPVIISSSEKMQPEDAGTVAVTRSTCEQVTQVPKGSSEESTKSSESSSLTESSSENISIASKKPKVSVPHDISVIALLAVNTIPVFGVLFFDWDAFLILFLYCSENLVVGFYNALKMAFAAILQPSDRHGLKFADRLGTFLITIPFFILHYGGFTAGHCFIVCVIFNKSERFLIDVKNWPTEIIIALMALLISHGVSFVRNYALKREFASVTYFRLMIGPYVRMVLTHIAVLIGAFITMALGSPVFLLVTLVVLKTALDLILHLRIHKKIIIVTDRPESVTKDEPKPAVKEKEVVCKEQIYVSSPSSSRKSLAFRAGRLVSLCFTRLGLRK